MTVGDDAVRAELKRRLARRGAAKQVAADIGVSPSILCRVAKGALPPSEKVAEGLGFRRVVAFERVG